MDKIKAIQSINEIKELMERSSKFVSLSGLTGILVGVYALVGSWMASRLLQLNAIVLIATGVLLSAIITVLLISYYKSKKSNQKLFNKLTCRISWNFSIPLLAGGLFCIALIYHKHYEFTSSAMLLFYGMALVNVAKYTFSNVAWLGCAFMALGIFDSFFVGHGLLCWALGFGVFHIVYGILFYFLYERNN